MRPPRVRPLGQAARSRRTIAVDDVPADYVTVSSGLGGAAPVSLVVLPVMAEEQVLGVIELASTGCFTPVHRDYLDQLMEAVGVNVNTIIANARTDELLGECQRLAGELEIEQARKELEARARELARASRYKSEFLATMSHELRTPLNSLLILAQLLAPNPSRNITPKQVENIYGAFQQADGTTSRTFGGTGLGLSICREIAYLLGGSIHAQSTQDEGSCFILYLPTVHPAAQDTAAPPAAATAPAAAGPGAESRDRRGTAPGSLGRHGEAGLAADTHGAPPAGRRVLVVEASPRGPLSLLTESAVADPPGVPTPVRVDTAADSGVAAASTPSRPFSAYRTRRLD
ncbi:GAF domain-containing protein [Streptomyces sp. S1A1-7]|nr:GAF domain-containing protein [Streptomyces sp. S1A1-7]QDN91513.1 GAF domain-containing protein [Streptomyces sp. RLB3-6]QDO12337.1 GAF domain-containing protein [Streptomyces sp. S1D4-23]